MGMQDQGLAARSAMCARIDALAREMAHVSQMRLVQELDDIRRTARRHGLSGVATVIHAVESAVARGERGPMVLSWLDTLRDVCDCEALDEQAGEAFAAAISVRLAH